jgi:hypothetical protein
VDILAVPLLAAVLVSDPTPLRIVGSIVSVRATPSIEIPGKHDEVRE